MNWIEREHENVFQTYKRLPIVISRAEGAYIIDDEENTYLDFLGGIAVNALGHSHPRILEAMLKQSYKYMHVSNYFYQKPQIKLAEKLIDISGMQKVFFTNSGTEATDGAMKLARRWGHLNGKEDIVAFSGGFHGRTYGALSIMDKPMYKEGMGPYLDKTRILPFNDLQALEQGIDNNTAAVFLELVQGEGGIVVANKDFVNKLHELKEKYNFLIVIDEIQSGIGRTGKYFSYQHYNFTPDLVTSAKGLGGGLPLGAILGSNKVESVWDKGMHGTTYGGNAVACATGSVVLKELKNGILKNVNDIGDYLNKCLVDLMEQFPDQILEVRGMGLMRGLLLSFDANIIVNTLLENKVITNSASGNVLRLVPPLIIMEKEVDKFYKKARKSFRSL